MSKRDYQQYFLELEALGYKVTKARKHYKILAPDGSVYFASSTPSDHRALLNLQADIRRGRPKKNYKK